MSTKRGGLEQALARYSIGLTIVPVLVVGVLTFALASRSLEQRITEDLEEQAYQQASAIDALLANAAADISTWADLSVFKGALIFDAFDKAQQYVSDLATAYPRYRAIHLFDGNGMLVASSGGSAEESLVEADELEAALGGVPSSSGLRRARESGGLGVVFAAPVRDGRDIDVTGALIVELDWHYVLGIVRNSEDHGRARGLESFRITLVGESGWRSGGHGRAIRSGRIFARSENRLRKTPGKRGRAGTARRLCKVRRSGWRKTSGPLPRERIPVRSVRAGPPDCLGDFRDRGPRSSPRFPAISCAEPSRRPPRCHCRGTGPLHLHGRASGASQSRRTIRARRASGFPHRDDRRAPLRRADRRRCRPRATAGIARAALEGRPASSLPRAHDGLSVRDVAARRENRRRRPHNPARHRVRK